MRTKKGVLFGLDGSDFAKQALEAVAGLLKSSPDFHLTLFHGAAEPDFAMFSDLFEEDPDAMAKHRAKWQTNARQVLENAAASLTDSGFDPEALSTVFDGKCSDPTGAMLKQTRQEGRDTLAVARWGKATVSRQVIGSVTYRLSQLTDDLALWVIDPRICSHNVLITLVGAPVSRRVVDYAVRYFGHLKESTFTLMHVTPSIPPQYWESQDIAALDGLAKQEKMVQWLKAYTENVKAVAEDAREKLVAAGIPGHKVVFKLEPQKKGIARDICRELEEGDHGILVMGRRGYKDIKEFRLGSKAHKMLLNGRTFLTCLVD